MCLTEVNKVKVGENRREREDYEPKQMHERHAKSIHPRNALTMYKDTEHKNNDKHWLKSSEKRRSNASVNRVTHTGKGHSRYYYYYYY